jgi:quercetin dioxygenase-like cupin family protein
MYTATKSVLGRLTMVMALVCGPGILAPALQEARAGESENVIRVVRLYTGPDQRSHFEDLTVPLKDGGKIGFLSELVKATGVVFRITTGEYNYDFHPAPRRQYVVNLEGEVEIEVGDGTRRILRSGEILLAEDTTGQGHISRAIAGKPRKSLFITLD